MTPSKALAALIAPVAAPVDSRGPVRGEVVQRLGDAGREATDETNANVVAQRRSLRPQPSRKEFNTKEVDGCCREALCQTEEQT